MPKKHELNTAIALLEKTLSPNLDAQAADMIVETAIELLKKIRDDR